MTRPPLAIFPIGGDGALGQEKCDTGAALVGLDPYQRFVSTRYFASLDGLRCLSILAVVWHHSTPRPPAGLAGRGHLGVHLFFAISGFLITTLLLRERRETEKIALGQFYWRRTLRIFPLYYLVLLLHLLFALGLSTSDPVRRHFFESLPFFASYTANWFVDWRVPHQILFAFAWSLAAEEQFYLFWPALLKWFKGMWPALFAMVALIVLDQLAERRLLASVLGSKTLLETVVTSFVPAIGVGAVFALLLDHEPAFRVLYSVLGRAFSAPLALAGVLALAAFSIEPFIVFCAALAALVVACAVRPDHGLSRILELAPVRYVGVVSYGLYLFHVPVIGAVRATWPSLRESSLVVFTLALPPALALTALSHRFFERPLRSFSWKARFVKPTFQTN